MLEKKIIIIGGSIAGCAIGVLLQKLGLNFVIIEKLILKRNDQT